MDARNLGAFLMGLFAVGVGRVMWALSKILNERTKVSTFFAIAIPAVLIHLVLNGLEDAEGVAPGAVLAGLVVGLGLVAWFSRRSAWEVLGFSVLYRKLPLR